jgi:hypothetical protein
VRECRAEALARSRAAAADYLGMESGAVVRRRGHPQCACCKLPVSIRSEIAKRAKAGDSLTSVSEFLIGEGHGIGRAGVTNHVRKCLAVEEPDGTDPASRSALVAYVVANHMRGWPGRLEVIAQALNEDGLTTEALIIQSEVPETMRHALVATEGTPMGELLAARSLAMACSRVLGVSHPDAAREIAADLAKQGCDDLAADLLYLATKATQDRQSERDGARQAAGPAASPTASNHEETA